MQLYLCVVRNGIKIQKCVLRREMMCSGHTQCTVKTDERVKGKHTETPRQSPLPRWIHTCTQEGKTLMYRSLAVHVVCVCV